jgi:hypothetical protein
MRQRRSGPIKPRTRQRKVFANGRRPQRRMPWRQSLEGLLLLALGAGLLAFLSWLPQRIDALVVVSEAIADLIRGLSQLLEALLGIGAVLLLAALLLVSLIALVSGCVRIIRAFSQALAPAAKRSGPQR